MDIPCRKSHVQDYECQVIKKKYGDLKGIAFDVCLGKELFYLWDLGIRTTGCCCGKHVNDKLGLSYIGVVDEDIQKMKDLGYEVRPNSCRPDAEDSFIPKTIL